MTDPSLWKQWSRVIRWFLGIAFVAYVAYFVYSMATGEERMTAVCQTINPGMTVEQLVLLAEEHGLGPRRNLDTKTSNTYLAETRTFGRHACKVGLDAGIVKHSSYNFAD